MKPACHISVSRSESKRGFNLRKPGSTCTAPQQRDTYPAETAPALHRRKIHVGARANEIPTQQQATTVVHASSLSPSSVPIRNGGGDAGSVQGGAIRRRPPPCPRGYTAGLPDKTNVWWWWCRRWSGGRRRCAPSGHRERRYVERCPSRGAGRRRRSRGIPRPAAAADSSIATST